MNNTLIWPTVILALMVLAAGLGVVLFKHIKKSKTGEVVDLHAYYSAILKTIKKTVSILSINMEEFTDKESYMRCVISTTIEYLKEDASDLGIPVYIIELINTEALTNIITEVINDNYFECFDVLSEETIIANQALLEDHFVACKCGIEGCACEEGKCDCAQDNGIASMNLEEDGTVDISDTVNNFYNTEE